MTYAPTPSPTGVSSSRHPPKQDPRRESAHERQLRAASVCRWPDPEGGAGLLQSAQDLRGTPEGTLQHRGHRSHREPGARARRPDPRAADAGAAPAHADQEDHRRSLQHRTRARGPGPSPPPAPLVNETSLHALANIEESQPFVLRLYVTG